jgi:hypothetical protein
MLFGAGLLLKSFAKGYALERFKRAQQPTHPVLKDTLLFEKKRREQPIQNCTLVYLSRVIYYCPMKGGLNCKTLY